MKNNALLILSILLFANGYAQQNKMNLIVGTYTNSCESKGIYVYDFDVETAEVKLKSSTDKVVNPSYLTVSADNKFVYSVNENGVESTVSSFEFNARKGDLKFINKQNSEGADPCFILNDTKNVIVANYSGGSISVFKKNSKGGLSEVKQVLHHKGKGPNVKRQQSSHVHMVQFTPDKKFVLANDLGTDKIYVYEYKPDSENEILVIKDSISLKKGSGPRHLTFSPNGKFAYLLHELDGTLSVFSYENQKLTKLEEAQIIDEDFKGETSAADIHITPDGKFLYASNRGTANDITCFAIQKNGRLNYIGHNSTLGKGPRNFVIDPTANFLLVGNQYTNEVVIFKINKANGKLTDTGKRIELCSPVCLIFAP